MATKGCFIEVALTVFCRRLVGLGGGGERGGGVILVVLCKGEGSAGHFKIRYALAISSSSSSSGMKLYNLSRLIEWGGRKEIKSLLEGDGERKLGPCAKILILNDNFYIFYAFQNLFDRYDRGDT